MGAKFFNLKTGEMMWKPNMKSWKMQFLGKRYIFKWLLSAGFNCSSCSPLSGEAIQFDERIFQMGWFNHQLDSFPLSFISFRWFLSSFSKCPLRHSMFHFKVSSGSMFISSMLVFVTPPAFNSSPLKNDGWKTILSYWEGNFSGANC